MEATHTHTHTHTYIYIYIYIYMLHSDIHGHAGYILTQWITDAGRLFINICTSHFIARVRKGLLKVCVWDGAGDRTETVIFWPQTYARQRCVFLVHQMLNRRPWGPLCWVLAFFTSSYQHLLWTPTHQGFKAPSAWCGFPYHISYITPSPALTGTRTQLSYIIVPRPLDRPLDLWNRMFDRHQTEITVMQFTRHSLPVRQSMSVP